MPIVWRVLAFFSEDFQKASRDKTEYNDLEMKHMMGLFDAQKERKRQKRKKKKKKNGTKMNLKREINKREENKYKSSKIKMLNKLR